MVRFDLPPIEEESKSLLAEVHSGTKQASIHASLKDKTDRHWIQYNPTQRHQKVAKVGVIESKNKTLEAKKASDSWEVMLSDHDIFDVNVPTEQRANVSDHLEVSRSMSRECKEK